VRCFSASGRGVRVTGLTVPLQLQMLRSENALPLEADRCTTANGNAIARGSSYDRIGRRVAITSFSPPPGRQAPIRGFAGELVAGARPSENHPLIDPV